MKQHEDYISGPHHYWSHFCFGVFLGALLGLWLFGDIFESGILNLLVVGVTAISCGLFGGRWGDVAWHRISEWLSWWFGTLR